MHTAIVTFCLLATASLQGVRVQGLLRKEGSRLRNSEFMASQTEREAMDILGEGIGSMTSSPAPPVTATPTSLTASPVVSTLAPASAPPVSGPPVASLPPTVAPAPTPANGTAPSLAPTTSDCQMTEDERIAGILARLDAVADPDKIRDNSFPQGLATTWLLEETGQFRVCPQDDTCSLEQRWVLAVIYFSTGGPEWFQCSANPSATDACGAEEPFVGDSRFLSDTSECDWAGISCVQGCVTEVEFEKNNLVGTIATEIGLLKELRIWGMEQGGLTGPIPTEIGELSKLIFLDLDFNAITGSISTQLLSLSNLTQLDLNDNQMTGSVSGIGVYPRLEFLQLHKNAFTGTIPDSLGQSSAMAAFTLHETGITGTMPESICNLLESRGNGGVLTSLIADCSPPNPEIECNCCTDCRRNIVG